MCVVLVSGRNYFLSIQLYLYLEPLFVPLPMKTGDSTLMFDSCTLLLVDGGGIQKILEKLEHETAQRDLWYLK